MRVLHARLLEASLTTLLLCHLIAGTAAAATTHVPAGGNLQAAIDAARPGDTITLEPGATYVGNFRLPVHGGSSHITIRSAASDSLLPGSATRITPGHSAHLPKLRSGNTSPVISTAPGAAFWRLLFLELQATNNGFYDIVTLGSGSEEEQTSMSQVPHDLVIDRVYIHGDRLHGQKRGISLHSGRTWIINSHISDIRAIGQDSMAIGGWNGPGPYHIENNYLEAAGEVIIFGGAIPGIPNVVPSDIVIRRNTITRPLSWRDPIVPTPTNVRATVAGGGGLQAGQYTYRVVAWRPAYDSEAVSRPSTEVTVSAPAGAIVQLAWDAVPDATEYRVYGRTPGGSSYWTVKGTTFSDTGSAATGNGGPEGATVWQVKNLFELKNGRRVQVDYNTFENNWAEAQTGVAILFTPRAEAGRCLWCVVEDVTVEYNTIRRVGSGFNILGVDDHTPSQQANNIIIRHNEISDMGAPWGGNGYFLLMLGGPRDIIVDHNTIIADNGGGILQLDGPPILGFVFTNNVGRHNEYGIIGTARAPGHDSINAFLPESLITHNVLAGGQASLYPPGNFFPSVAQFESHFTSYSGGDFTLKPGTDWENAGNDGRDLGAIFDRRGGVAALRAPQGVKLY
jgi:hypothetical protein